jgi:hypothetical protein
MERPIPDPAGPAPFLCVAGRKPELKPHSPHCVETGVHEGMNRSRWLMALRWVAAGVLGYVLISVLTTLGFSTWLGDPAFSQEPWEMQAKGALVAVAAGLSGGALAALLGRARPVLHTLAVLPFLIVDSGYVLFFLAPRRDPFLYDLGAALTLIAATLAGGVLVSRRRDRLRAPDASATPAARVRAP